MFLRIYNLNMNKSYKFLVKTNTCSLGYKNQTICSNETPFDIQIDFCELISMTPRKFEIYLADFL